MSTVRNTFCLLLVFYMFPGECTLLYGQAGEDITINCGVPPNSNVEWKLNDNLLIYVDGKKGSKRKGSKYSQSKHHTNGDALKITKLDKSDSGTYTCRQSGNTYNVHVVSVSANPGTVLPQSADVELHCNVPGDSRKEVQWLRPPNGQQYPERKQIINLKSVTSNDEGQWTCQVQELKINITLTIVGLQTKEVIEVPQGGDVVLPCSLPKRTSRSVSGGKWQADHLNEVSSASLDNTASEAQMEIYAQVGGTVVLPRDTYGGTLDDSREQTKKVYVNWFRGSEGTSLISRNPQSGIQLGLDKKRFSMLSDFSLQISPVEESDFDVFRCEQHVIIEEYKKIYRLRRVTVPKVQAVMVGDPLSLKCDLEESQFSYSAKINWIQPKSPQCNHVSRSGGHFSVPNMPVCASGVWTCSVKYNQMELKATTTVFVIDLSPAPSDSIYTSLSNSSVNVPCSLSSDIPWNLLNETGLQGGSWTFSPLGNEKQQPSRNILHLNFNHSYKWVVTNGGGIPVQGRELKDKDLSILKMPVSANISGEYTCTLNFKSRTFSRKVKVEVLYVSSTAGNRLFEGQMVNLSCSLGPDSVTPEVKWICPSCSTHPLLRTSPHPAFLSMHVRMEDKGRWRCELWKNKNRLTYAEISLRIEKVPVDIWLCVAIGSGVVVFILLLVIIIIAIRRHKQMLMYRRRKTRFCCCKTPQPKGFYKT